MMIRKATTGLMMASMFGFAGMASATIVTNGGFEAGTGADADGWANIVNGPNGTVGRSSLDPNTGGSHAYLEFDNDTNPAAGAAYFIEQTTAANTLDNTVDYDLSFSARADTLNFVGTDAFVQVLWLDQDASNGGGVQGENLFQLASSLTTSYQEFNFDGLDAPDGADSFILRFQLSAGAVQGSINGLYIDDAALVAIPEPGSLALLGLGGLVLARRRRS